jgi:hypothetical protein
MLGADSICCLLHNLIPSGSARQWIHILERHVATGGRATIVAPDGPLAGWAREAGIEVVDHDWDAGTPTGAVAALDGHDLAVVHWDPGVASSVATVLEHCPRVLLSAHRPPNDFDGAREALVAVAAAPHAAILVCGEIHRRRMTDYFDLPLDAVEILPASIPADWIAYEPFLGEPEEILALVRLAPEKLEVPILAANLVRARRAAGYECRLSIAGEGDAHDEVLAYCERWLPADAWSVEPAPPDPLARLAAAPLAVARGLTTLECAALGRRVIVAHPAGPNTAAGTVLTPGRYDEAARDPYSYPYVTRDSERLWADVLAVDADELRGLRDLVAEHNSIETAIRALRDTVTAL